LDACAGVCCAHGVWYGCASAQRNTYLLYTLRTPLVRLRAAIVKRHLKNGNGEEAASVENGMAKMSAAASQRK
jgi:hypothetical protein